MARIAGLSRDKERLRLDNERFARDNQRLRNRAQNADQEARALRARF